MKTATAPVNPEYIYIQQENRFQPARVLGYNGNNVTGELYYYSDKVKVTVPLSKTKPIAFAEYQFDMNVQVEWKGKELSCRNQRKQEWFPLYTVHRVRRQLE